MRADRLPWRACVLVLSTGQRATPRQATNPELADLTLGRRTGYGTCRRAAAEGFGVYQFRKTFDLASVPARFVDPCHRGQPLRAVRQRPPPDDGPARGDLESLAIRDDGHRAALARAATCMAAWSGTSREEAPMAQVTPPDGTAAAGRTARGGGWSTPDRRGRRSAERCRCRSCSSIGHRSSTSTSSAGPASRSTAQRYPWGWETAEFADTAWAAVAELTIGGPRAIRDTPVAVDARAARQSRRWRKRSSAVTRIARATAATRRLAVLRGQRARGRCPAQHG